MPSAIPTKERWHVMIGGKPASADLDRCTNLVRAYHLKQAADVDERLFVADEILKTARAYLDAHGVTGTCSDVIGLLALAAEKEKKTIRKASGAWAAVRKIFAPSGSPHGPARTVQHAGAGADVATSVSNYWLEALDPWHRSWGHREECRQAFEAWLNTDTDLGLWEWLEATGRAGNVASVQYLAPDERWRYWIVFGDDKKLYRHETAVAQAGPAVSLRLFSTSAMSTAFSGPGFAIWVCGPGGIFYSASHEVSRFHHSSFLAGGRVLAAGEWAVSNGTILLITHKTGHYLATPLNLLRALRLLQPMTDLARTVAGQTDFATKTTRYVKALEFIEKEGDAGRCEQIKDERGAPVRTAADAMGRAAGYGQYAL